MMRWLFRVGDWVRRQLETLAGHFSHAPKLTIMRLEELPKRPSCKHVYVIGEGEEDWYASVVCPCGCGAIIDLNLVPPGRPCWRVLCDEDGAVSLAPSIWRQGGCQSHFRIRRGGIIWASDAQIGEMLNFR